MKSKLLLCVHVSLLLLACTRFSVVSWMWGKWSWTWDYFKYSHQNGWGYQYNSDYSVATVLAYLAAFATGIFGYATASGRISNALRVPSLVLCVLGTISFLIEGGHWLLDYNLSWIAICPAASLVLAAIAISKIFVARTGHAEVVETPV